MYVCVCVPTASGLAVMDEVDLTPSVVWTELGSTERKIVGSEEWSIFCQETLVLMGILADTGTLTKQNIERATKVTLTAYKVSNCYCENSNSSGQMKKKKKERELV